MMAVANLRSEYVCFSFAQSLRPGNKARRYKAADARWLRNIGRRLKAGENVPEGTKQFDRLQIKMHWYDADSARPSFDSAQLLQGDEMRRRSGASG
jgi:hypothetical protein